MSGLSRETRLQIMLDEDELAAIDDWRFKHRMPSRAAAVRDLLMLGLQAAKGPTDPNMRSQDFGVSPRRDPDGDDGQDSTRSRRGMASTSAEILSVLSVL